MKNLNRLTFILILLITTSCGEQKGFYLHPNGVTIMCPNTEPGETGNVDGVEYESVKEELLKLRRDEGKNLRYVCTSLVTDMSELFKDKDFNQEIGNWDVSNVTDMMGMFYDSEFNQPLESWDVSNVTNMSHMFSRNEFNYPIGNWDVHNVTDMSGIFSDSEFNQSIENWDVSSVTNMRFMFSGNKFNYPIGNWDVGNVTDMSSMFSNSEFNQPIENWDVSSVTEMEWMFWRSLSFNKDLSGWCVSKIETEPIHFSRESPLTEENKPVWGTCPD